MTQFDRDKHALLTIMRKWCLGYENAHKKHELMDCLPIEIRLGGERYFRLLTSALKKDGLLSSTSSKGYWINDSFGGQKELLEQKKSVLEMKSRALHIIEGCDKQIKEIENKLNHQIQHQLL